MPENSVLLHIEYAENHENKQQGECQSAYFGHTSSSIFTAAAYIRLNEKTEKISIVSVSEAKDHLRIASHSFILKSIEMIAIRYPHLDQFGSLGIRYWSDGCSAQFRFQFAFQLTTHFPSRINVIRYYNERHHGKCPIDSIGGYIKSTVYNIDGEKIVIHTPLDFNKSAQKLVKRNAVCVFAKKKCND